MLCGKIHPKVVQELLGHANVTVTLDTYSHVLPNMQGQATEMMDAMLSKNGLQYGCSKAPRLSFGGSNLLILPIFCKYFRSGGTRTRTGDTMIFSHVRRVSGCSRRFQKPLISATFPI